MDDTELQDEPLQIRIMDHDTYSANDAIGKVYFNLNPLLLPQPTVVQLSGQQTLADTLISNQSQTTGTNNTLVPIYFKYLLMLFYCRRIRSIWMVSCF